MRPDLPNCTHCRNTGVVRPFVMVGKERFEEDPTPCTRCVRGALGVGIGLRHAHASMGDFEECRRANELLKSEPADDEALDAVNPVWFAGWSLRASSWYLFGPAGVGKTHLAAAIAIRLMSRDYWPAFITARELLAAIKATWDGDEDAPRRLRKVQDADIIALDDLGAEQVTDWSETQLTGLVDGWYREERPLIVTSNYSPSGLVDKYGERLAGRLAEMTRQFHMDGPDRRLGASRE